MLTEKADLVSTSKGLGTCPGIVTLWMGPFWTGPLLVVNQSLSMSAC